MLVREIELTDEVVVEIEQNTSSGELGATVWDCALVTVHAFAASRSNWDGVFKGKHILDMSCGTGVVGIAAAKMFNVGRLVLTDQNPLIPLIQSNVERNKVKAETSVFDWGGDISTLKGPFDVIILSDVVVASFSSGYGKLLTSLWDLSHDKTFILLTVELRAQEDNRFFQLLRDYGFNCVRLERSWLDANWESEDIRVFRVSKQPDEALYK